MSQLPVVYNKSLLSFANQNITDPMTYSIFITTVQQMLDKAIAEENESKKRSQERCQQVKEEIMIRTWCPQRVETLLNLGYEIEDM